MARLLETSDFSLSVPDKWSHRITAMITKDEVSQGFRESIIITSDEIADSVSVEDYRNELCGSIRQRLGDVSFISLDPVTVAGAEHPAIRFSWQPEGSPPIAQLQLLLVCRPLIWVLTRSTLLSSDSLLDEDLAWVLRSFTPKKRD